MGVEATVHIGLAHFLGAFTVLYKATDDELMTTTMALVVTLRMWNGSAMFTLRQKKH